MRRKSNLVTLLSVACALLLATSLGAISSGKLKVPDAKVVLCEELAAPASSAACVVSPGEPALRIQGKVPGFDVIYQGGEVLVDTSGLISHVGCAADRPASLEAMASTATAVVCSEGVVSPGLINAHDHLYFDHNYPFPDTGERYNHPVGGATPSEVPPSEVPTT